MKRLTIIAAAAITLAGPLTATSAFADPPRQHQRGHDRDYQRDYQRDGNHWRRGQRVTQAQRAHFRQVDWRREHLRAPPRGYRYERDDDSGETLLVGLATGAILGIILASQ